MPKLISGLGQPIEKRALTAPRKDGKSPSPLIPFHSFPLGGGEHIGPQVFFVKTVCTRDFKLLNISEICKRKNLVKIK